MLQPGEAQTARTAAQRDETIHHAHELRIRKQQRLRARHREVFAVELGQRLDLIGLGVAVAQPCTAAVQVFLILGQRGRVSLRLSNLLQMSSSAVAIAR